MDLRNATFLVRKRTLTWFMIDITEPDKTRHIAGGFGSAEEADEWIKARKRGEPFAVRADRA